MKYFSVHKKLFEIWINFDLQSDLLAMWVKLMDSQKYFS